VDYSQAVDLADEPLNVELNALVERATAVTMELPRSYLGASIIGHECDRQVQFDWWVRPLLPARVKSIFARGHFFEARMREQLVAAGFAFASPEALEFTALDGYLQGHADGVVIAAPPLPGVYLATPCVWECKALNGKNWRAVGRDGLAKVFPRYSVQIGLYQRFLNKTNPALVTCVNADTCEALHFALAFNPMRTEQAIDRAIAIIAATRAGELLPRFTTDPNDWRCAICSHRERCWR
jgi:hypothetical protein